MRFKLSFYQYFQLTQCRKSSAQVQGVLPPVIPVNVGEKWVTLIKGELLGGMTKVYQKERLDVGMSP